LRSSLSPKTPRRTSSVSGWQPSRAKLFVKRRTHSQPTVCWKGKTLESLLSAEHSRSGVSLPTILVR
jgi:hypothetical protein